MEKRKSAANIFMEQQEIAEKEDSIVAQNQIQSFEHNMSEGRSGMPPQAKLKENHEI